MGSVLLAKREKVSHGEFGRFVVDMPLQELEASRRYRRYGVHVL
jgi:hypothetical protein